VSNEGEIKLLSDDELLQVVHSEGGLLFGPPSQANRELAIKELINRGFDDNKFKLESGKLKKRAEVPLEASIFITNIFLPSNDFFQFDIERFRKYGFEKKVQQNLISKFLGFVLYAILGVGFIIYLNLRD